MMSIEVITSRKRTIVLWDEERQERVERKVLIWNETVSNLTLMALGSSAPEILIAIVETISNLPMTVEEAAVLQNTEALGEIDNFTHNKSILEDKNCTGAAS